MRNLVREAAILIRIQNRRVPYIMKSAVTTVAGPPRKDATGYMNERSAIMSPWCARRAMDP